MPDNTLTLPDNRQLSYTQAGAPDGTPVLVFNGTPSSKLLFQPWIDDALEKGIRLISYDRPGYGGSTPNPGRSVASVTQDVAALAEHLGIDKLAVWGVSGGGPHTLACAALLPDLVAAAASLAAPAPYLAEDLNWFDGMGESNIEAFNVAREGRDKYMPYIEERAPDYLNATTESIREGFRSLLTPVDAAVVTDDFAKFLLDSINDAIVKRRDGWADDGLAMVVDWGFSLNQIKIPVLLMHGPHDKFVPFAHGEWLAKRIPGVEARLLPNDGHLTLSTNRVPEVHAWLLNKMG